MSEELHEAELHGDKKSLTTSQYHPGFYELYSDPGYTIKVGEFNVNGQLETWIIYIAAIPRMTWPRERGSTHCPCNCCRTARCSCSLVRLQRDRRGRPKLRRRTRRSRR